MTTPATPTTAAQTVEPKQKAKWEFADGKVYEADSAEELLQLVGKRYNDLWPEFKKVSEENQALTQAQQQIIEEATKGKEEGQFDSKHYFELMAQDPLKAQKYANEHDPDYQKAIAELRSIQQIQQANAFRAEVSDFKDDPSEVEQLANACVALFPGSDVFTKDQMKAAYAFTHFRASPGEEPAKSSSPPKPPRGSAGQVPSPINPDAMSKEDLRKMIEKMEQEKS